MTTSDLLGYVRAELKRRRGEWQAIADASGVPYFTLAKIAAGTTQNPRWRTLERLLEHFGDDKDAA